MLPERIIVMMANPRRASKASARLFITTSANEVLSKESFRICFGISYFYFEIKREPETSSG
jgi:cyclophilin family peptidyl-prolyl cis-trans isomerase